MLRFPSLLFSVLQFFAIDCNFGAVLLELQVLNFFNVYTYVVLSFILCEEGQVYGIALWVCVPAMTS
jgi:hypothetical protein